MAFELALLQNVTRLSPNVLRILGQNPGPYTLQGSNTYLVGARPPFVLVDTGEGRSEYIPYLSQALSSYNSDGPLISDIIVTHKHRDHWGGLPSTLALLVQLWHASPKSSMNRPFPAPKLHKFPLNQSSSLAATTTDTHHVQLTEALGTLLPGSFQPSTAEEEGSDSLEPSPVLHALSNTQVFAAQDVTLKVIHTPGHTSDSICLFLPEEGALFTADSILGHGTAVFEDLKSYLDSLHLLLDAFDNKDHPLRVIYPGHGPAITGQDAALNIIKTYITHRLDREREFVAVLESKRQDSSERRHTIMHLEPDQQASSDHMDFREWTLDEILAEIYPEHVRPMAKRGLVLHLEKLEKERRVIKIDTEVNVTRWKAVHTN